MRIVYVSTRSDTIGGSNVHIRDMALAMRRRGHDPHVLGGGDGPFAEDVRGHGLPYHPLRHLVRNVRPYRDLAAVLEMRGHLTTLRPQLLSLHTAKAGFVGRLAAWGLRVPIVYTPHGWPFTPGVPPVAASVYATLERISAPLADRIVNVCAFERDIALERRIGRPERHAVIHNGMPDVPTRLHADPTRQPPRLIMVARFEEQKDQGTLLRALAACRDLPWTVQLVGDGPLIEESREHAARLGLGDRVEFAGARRDVAELLAQCQLFVLSTRWEGFPRSILEAMRAGLPIVASAVGGIHEAVVEGENGFVVPRHDDAALAARLRTLIGDAALRARLGADGRRRYSAHFTFEAMLARTLEVYEALVPGAAEVVEGVPDAPA